MRISAVVSAALLTLSAAACSSGSAGTGRTTTPQAPVKVYAAASLQQVFTELGEGYRAETGTPVELSFGGSSDLVTQLANGAPGDVLATADEANMKKAIDGKLVTAQPTVFATNTLVIAVANGNPKGISAYADLAKPGVTLVRCAPQVPCGAAAQKVEKAAGVTTKPVSEENSVTDVLGKVSSGQADTGLVYATDVARSGGKAQAVEFAESSGVVNRYPIAPLAAVKNNAGAQGFVAYVTGPKGQEALAKAGFGKP
ncbi:molybdate ABC transporter substrate-binding protein [Mariniluteicoccus endophyticus]